MRTSEYLVTALLNPPSKLSRRGGSSTACTVAMAHPRTIPTHRARGHAQDSSSC
ncbi:hypothetical protein PLICRDRAFT_43755 [Plicaturopsis crispa FD-325 SS-3]|nr:hypothetical protein PLICRDRAFT_43755 [Plicaturopsis crispa FD-325 SS-3]